MSQEISESAATQIIATERGLEVNGEQLILKNDHGRLTGWGIKEHKIRLEKDDKEERTVHYFDDYEPLASSLDENVIPQELSNCRYIVGQRIGQGASSEVSMAFDRKLGFMVAVKRLTDWSSPDTDEVEQDALATASIVNSEALSDDVRKVFLRVYDLVQLDSSAIRGRSTVSGKVMIMEHLSIHDGWGRVDSAHDVLGLKREDYFQIYKNLAQIDDELLRAGYDCSDSVDNSANVFARRQNGELEIKLIDLSLTDRFDDTDMFVYMDRMENHMESMGLSMIIDIHQNIDVVRAAEMVRDFIDEYFDIDDENLEFSVQGFIGWVQNKLTN